ERVRSSISVRSRRHLRNHGCGRLLRTPPAVMPDLGPGDSRRMGHRPLFAALTAAGLAVATLAMVPASAVEETDDAEAPPQETPSAQVRHIHASGYLKAGPRAFARDVAALQARTDIVTTTEVPHRVNSRSLRGNGWRRVWDPAPGYNENAISVRKEVWTVDEF